jgi:hypothetical protein
MAHRKPTSRTITTPPVAGRQLARALSAIAGDLVNPYSESTDDFTPFSAPLDPSKPFDDAALRLALHVADRYRLDKRAMDPHAFDEWGEPYLSSYATLCKVMKATLTDIQVIWARAPGVVRVRVWFVGRMGTELLVGLRTQSTET